MNETDIYQIQRPSPMLLKLYIIRSILSGPFIIFSLPVLLFRYYTLKYRFDGEGISMRWGFIFRREVNLTYARIQDIHLTSGVIQRWLGLADLKIQTASGSAEPEMTIEGIIEYEKLRDFLYTKMRGYRDLALAKHAAPSAVSAHSVQIGGDAVKILTGIGNELRATREALERIALK
ncbi:MAG: PH domain-containing protein [Victivallales bacterium]|jgi:putative membrane protein